MFTFVIEEVDIQVVFIGVLTQHLQCGLVHILDSEMEDAVALLVGLVKVGAVAQQIGDDFRARLGEDGQLKGALENR